MTIREITAAAWDVPMRAPYRSAQRVTTTARNVRVRVTLADGTQGYGESAPAFYVTSETQESVLQAVQEQIPWLVGRDAADSETLDLLAARLPTAPGARGALEIALADAEARAAGVPLYRYLGGSETLVPERATDLSLPILPPDEAAVRAAQAATDGFHALKLKVGSENEAEDAARVRAVAAAAPNATLRLDGNQGFTPEAAVRFLDELSDLAARIELLEQPTKAGNDDGLRFVAERVPCPVFADEAVHHEADARRLLETGACKGIVLKLAKSGLYETARIARAAQKAGGRCLFGCMMETRVANGAALHLALALGAETVPLLDLDGHLLVQDEEIVRGGLTQTGDVLRVSPTAPGLGLEVID